MDTADATPTPAGRLPAADTRDSTGTDIGHTASSDARNQRPDGGLDAAAEPVAGNAVPSDARRRDAEALARARRRRFLAETALSLVLPWLVWKSGLGVWLSQWVLRWPCSPASSMTPGGLCIMTLDWIGRPGDWLRVALLVAVLLLAYRLALLPLGYFAGYRLSRRYGLTTQTTGGWLLDWLKVTALSVGIGALLAVLFYASVAALGANWWWVYALVLTGGVLLLLYLTPYVLVPLFYRLRPLDAGPLVERIDALFARAGVRQPRIAAIELSAKTTAANAAVIGFGTSRRVVLGDTLLQTFTPDEIETVVAHELGHHVRGDIWRGIAIEVAAIWLALELAALLVDPLFLVFRAGDWRVPANFPQLVLLAEIAGLLTLPLGNAYSRHIERTADRYALELTRKPVAYAAAMRKLESQNLIEADPPRWAEWLLYTHPPVAQRIRAAEAYAHA
jgi:STE24 endopeptidase